MFVQAISLTEGALADHAEGTTAGSSDAVASGGGGASRKRKSRFESFTSSASAGALPMQVVDHIRAAKARSALEGHAPMGWAIGYACLARDSGGHWDVATVTAVTADGHFQVQRHEGSALEEVHKVDCRPQDTGVRFRSSCCSYFQQANTS